MYYFCAFMLLCQQLLHDVCLHPPNNNLVVIYSWTLLILKMECNNFMSVHHCQVLLVCVKYDAWFYMFAVANLPVIWFFTVMDVQLTVDDLQTVTQELLPVAERWKAIGCALQLDMTKFEDEIQQPHGSRTHKSAENYLLENGWSVPVPSQHCALLLMPCKIQLLVKWSLHYSLNQSTAQLHHGNQKTQMVLLRFASRLSEGNWQLWSCG